MRKKVCSAAIALLALTACEEPSEDLFKHAARVYFADQNSTASQNRRDIEDSGTGLVLSYYWFDPGAILILGAPCKKCGEENDIVDYTGKREIRCGKCDEKILDAGKTQTELENSNDLRGKVFPAFKVTQNTKPWKAEVRYIRKTYYWDPTGRVELPEGEQGKLQQSTSAVRDYAEGVHSAGLHRQLSTYHGKIELELRGARAVAVSPAREEPLRTWLYPLQPYVPTK